MAVAAALSSLRLGTAAEARFVRTFLCFRPFSNGGGEIERLFV